MTEESDDDDLVDIDEDLAEKIQEETSPPVQDETDDEDGDEPEVFYLSVEEIIEIHNDIIEDDPDAEPGLENRGDLEYVTDHIQYGTFGEGPETIHEKAYQLMRLIAANHPFVDGNKRTALASTVYFYFWNGYELEYQEELESMLILIAIREDFIDPDVAVEYLEDITDEVDFDAFFEELFEGWDVIVEMAENMRQDFETAGDDEDV